VLPRKLNRLVDTILTHSMVFFKLSKPGIQNVSLNIPDGGHTKHTVENTEIENTIALSLSSNSCINISRTLYHRAK
jgi:hypothetical protein